MQTRATHANGTAEKASSGKRLGRRKALPAQLHRSDSQLSSSPRLRFKVVKLLELLHEQPVPVAELLDHARAMNSEVGWAWALVSKLNLCRCHAPVNSVYGGTVFSPESDIPIMPGFQYRLAAAMRPMRRHGPADLNAWEPFGHACKMCANACACTYG